MRFNEFYTEEEGDETPDNMVPYQSKNQSGRLTLSPYTNDWDPEPGFKDVDALLSKIDKEVAAGNVQVAEVPTNRLLATQYWLDTEGGGDPVIPGLEDYPIVAYLSDGYYHIVDGHHRSDKAVGARAPQIKAYVFKL